MASNIQALAIAVALRDEQRSPNERERAVLDNFTAWGAVPEVFDETNTSFEYDRNQLKNLLSQEEYAAARETTLTAFYTSPDIVSAMWTSLHTAGYTTGPVLEPGCGTGNFIEHAPNPTEVVGVELDPISAIIAQARNPQAHIQQQSFVETPLTDNTFAATIGNVPFSPVQPFDPDRNRLHLNTHNYFISKSIDATAPGGYVAVITSYSTADSSSRRRSEARDSFAKRADFITGVRLPSGKNGAFSANAGTEAGADILIFRVREEGQEPTKRTELFQQATALTLDGNTIAVNKFFAEHPDHVLGDLQVTSARYGHALAVTADADERESLGQRIEQVLSADITDAKQQGLGLHPHFAESFEHRPVGELIAQATEDMHQVLGTIKYERTATGDIVFQQYLEPAGQAIAQWQTVKPPAQRYAEQWAQIIDIRDTTTALLTACSHNATGDITALRERLNTQYDAYTSTFGPINLHEEKKPRKRTETQVTKEYQRLEVEWRLDNAVDDRAFEGELPSEVVEQLMERARLPIVDETPVVAHLKGAIAQDPFLTTARAIEHYNADTKTAKKGALFFTNPIRTIDEPVAADTLADALTIVAHSPREITVENLADLLDDYTPEQVATELEANKLAFRDPRAPETWIPAPQYLSGAVRTKLTEARAAAAEDPRLHHNVEALEDAQPEKITSGISINLGASWIPQDIYRDFITEHLQIPAHQADEISLVQVLDKWSVSVPKYWHGRDDADLKWGVRAANASGEYNYTSSDKRMRRLSHHGLAHRGHSPTVLSAHQVLEAAMNMTAPAINYSGEAKELLGIAENKVERCADASRFAGLKTEELRTAFSAWAKDDPTRLSRLIDAYNDAFNNVVAPVYDGTAREMPGLSDKLTPYLYQRNAVERMVNEPAVLLNHVVGAGKTGSMIMGAMELRRMNLAEKPLMVVPNHLVEQIAREAKQWYPGANVLSGASARGGKDNRRVFMSQVATHDWDIIVVPESVFKLIPLSPEIESNYIEEQLALMRQDLETVKEAGGGHKASVKDIELHVKKWQEKLNEVSSKVGTDIGVTFDQAGIDYLIVDEAHGYKNLARRSGMSELAHPGSDKATDMDMKMAYLRSLKEPGRPTATFATGTPIANNMAEIWVMQRYLRPDLLHEARVYGVNSWAINFTEPVTEIGFTAGGAIKEQTKVSSYVNVGDLARMCTPFIDYVGRDQISAKLPEIVEGRTQTVEFDPGQEVKDFNRDLLWRESKLKQLNNSQIDNPLTLINHGKDATLDPRLAGLDHTPGVGRIAAIADNVHGLWDEHKDEVYTDQDGQPSPHKGAFQIVFCDKGVPSKTDPLKFTIYEALRQELVAKGMDKDRIRFIHDWDDRRIQLFDDCNNGKVDVLIGNTDKLGTGANIQSRCIAIHHADVPWKPADLEQRDGRGHRQGNQNDFLHKFVYVGRGTHDAFSWATVERKSRFIEQFWQADQSLREMESLSDDGTTLAHNKAIATGNPDFVRQVELTSEIARLEAGEKEFEALKFSNADRLRQARMMIPQQEARIERLKPYTEAAERWGQLTPEEKSWEFAGHTYTKRTEATQALVDVLADVSRQRQTQPTLIGTIAGVPLSAHYSYSNSALIVSSPVGNLPSGIPDNLVRDDLVRTGEEQLNIGQRRSGLLTRMESAVTGIAQQTEFARNDLAEWTATLERLESTDGVTQYPRSDELNAARDELNKINRRIEAFNNSAGQKQVQREYEQRLTEKGRVPGFSLALNPTRYMQEEGISSHPLSPAPEPPASQTMFVDTSLLEGMYSSNTPDLDQSSTLYEHTDTHQVIEDQHTHDRGEDEEL